MSQDEKPDHDRLLERLVEDLRAVAGRVVPRFARTMPAAYFRDTDPATQLSHLTALVAAEAGALRQSLLLRTEDGRRFTFINEGSYPGLLSELLAQLPHELPLCSAKVHTAVDGKLVLDVFEFGEPALYDPGDAGQREQVAAVVALAREQGSTLSEQTLAARLASCTGEYLVSVPAPYIYRHLLLDAAVRGSEDTAVRLDHRPHDDTTSIVVAVTDVDRRGMFERIAKRLGQLGVDIRRGYLDAIGGSPGDDGDRSVSLLSFLVQTPQGHAIEPGSALWRLVEHDLRRLKYLDRDVLSLAVRVPSWDLLHAEVITALCRLAHQLLVRRNPLLYTRGRILETVTQHVPLATAIAELFVERFDPERGPAPFDAPARALGDRIDREARSDEAQRVLRTLLSAVEATRRANLHLPQRYALALRLDPGFFAGTVGEDEPPFGVFFVHGRDFDGFHVRFRDIARGGLRIVRPKGPEQYALESERLYQESYDLAYAQQLKNKDIPEGGSKGVLLVQPDAEVDNWGRAYADGLLDLIVPDPAIRERLVDYSEGPELIHLGPDENVSNALITWIVDRARQRGYPNPNAFMSSKPGAGINHKAYGITSEGVTVFLEAALRAVGIDPRMQPFSIKLTGGPDGDVAGNEIRILIREYGERARIVGIADGSGCAEDPEGLDHAELMRLVDAELPVAAFAPDRLGPRGRRISIDEPGGLVARNTLHNRLKADAFVPAGGRPNTIDEDNWREFLDDGGRPSSRVIVEGANLFITPAAREHLAERGVIIVKDSSANKTGVICSSFEVLASMLLSEETFIELKERLVAEIVVRLRELARLEAETLFREHRHLPGVPLPALSTRLSRVIIRATDALTRALARLKTEDPALVHWLFEQHLPPLLLEHAEGPLFERAPAAYVDHAVASILASRIVYREGLGYFEQMSPEAIVELALEYLRHDRQSALLADQVSRSDLPDRELIASLLRDSGARASLRRPRKS